MPHHSRGNLAEETNKRKIVLVGNPNTGKSVVFQHLTGIYVDVSNFPGTTVSISKGQLGEDLVLDTPGVYGISAFNDEERVTRDIVIEADILINIVNASQLERDLFLTLQLADMGIPMVVGVNMLDEASARGIEIDLATLETTLGVPVVGLTATKHQGINELRSAISQAKPGIGEPELMTALPKDLPRSLGVLALEDDPDVTEKSGSSATLRETIYLRRRERVDALVAKASVIVATKPLFTARLGQWMIRPLTGIPLLFFTLFLMYQFVGVLIAQTVVDFLEEQVIEQHLSPWILTIFNRFVTEDGLIGQLLIGEFGLFTMTVTYILGLLLPLVLGFYLMLSILEDSGYLPRIATLLDRLLVGIGLNGKAIIPMILGFGCVTMATITTRMLGSRRERTIATFLLSLAIPCSAQLGVIAALLAPLGLGYALLYVVVIFMVYVLVGTLLHWILPGESSDLLIDLPTLRIPRASNVLQKTGAKTWHFLKEATPLFAIGSVLVSLLHWSGWLEEIQQALAPLTVGWLRLPQETATAFIMGIVRRDFGAAGLYDMVLNPAQVVIALITITLFVPCIASVMVIWKERGWKEWIGIFFGTFATAFLVGGIVARLIT